MSGPVNPAEWRKVSTRIEARLALQRERLEKPSLDATETAVVRGRIMELKDLLLWGEGDPAARANPLSPLTDKPK